MIEPELITIVEGPPPDFQPIPSFFFPSIMEGNGDADTLMCELRTMNGKSIVNRCRDAWKEGRPVQLVFKDDMLMKQTAEVVAMRLKEIDEGTLLYLWIRAYVEYAVEEMDGNEGDGADGLDTFGF